MESVTFVKMEKGQAAQESYRDVWRSCREKMARAKAQLELEPGTTIENQ